MTSRSNERDVSRKNILNSMKYLKSLSIKMQAFFTIWPDNMDEDWDEYRDYFESRGVYTSGRFGNVESANGRIKHVSEDKILEIRKKYSDIRLSVLLANDAEYKDYLSTFVVNDEFRCTDLKKINVFFTEDGIKASYYCPIVSTVYPEYFVDIRDLALPAFYEDLIKTGICPIAKEAMGFESMNLHHICRFHKSLPKRNLPEKALISF